MGEEQIDHEPEEKEDPGNGHDETVRDRVERSAEENKEALDKLSDIDDDEEEDDDEDSYEDGAPDSVDDAGH